MKYRFDLLQYWHDRLCEDFLNDFIPANEFLNLDEILTRLKESQVSELYIINLN